MKTEFECRFLDIDINKVREKLAAAGFICIQPETLQHRATFDLPEKDGAIRWLRLRDEGSGKTTLTLKIKNKGVKNVASLGEVEVGVASFDDMLEILNAAGHITASHEENLREKWTRDDIEVCLDTWPGLNPFCEIESDTADKVQRAAEELGFDWRAAHFGNVVEVYEQVLGLSLAEFQTCCNFKNPPKSKLS